MKEKEIKIIEKTILGVLNPSLRIYGITKEKKDSFKVVVKNEVKEHKFILLNQKGYFLLSCKLNKNDHNVDVYFDGIKIYRSHNIMIIRLINKFKSIVRRIIIKISSIVVKFIKPFCNGIKFLWKEHHFLVPPILWKRYFKIFLKKIKRIFSKDYYNPFIKKSYGKWLLENEKIEKIEKFEYNPLISILIPVYNIERKYLSECLDSVLNQSYQNFEVCLADDCSTNEDTIKTLNEYKKKDKRIKVIRRKKNGHISRTTNTALSIATGEFVGLMDDDDILTSNALYEMVKVLNEDKTLDFIYSDEDKMDMNGKFCEPHFKPDFSPDTLLGGNYICHFEIFRKSLMDKVGGEKHEFVGAQDFDLFLRITELTNKIYHIPKILYHWRKVPGSTADTIDNKEYAIDAGKKAVEEALKRRNLKADVELPIPTTQYVVNYKYDQEPLVSIIIPTRDFSKTLKKCLKSIFDKTDYKNYEVIVVDNNSEKKETFDLFKEYKEKYKNFRVIKANMKFNFSKINNLAAKKARGDFLLFLNNDTEVITEKWISYMVGYAMQKHIGAVGVKLLYPDDTIQHGGVVVGLGDFAQHTFLKVSNLSSGFYGRLLVPYNYSAVTAACMMVSKKKFEEVNGFEESLKVAYNDIDFCLKLLTKKYYNVFLPQVELYHYESKSRGLDTTSEKYKMFLEERKYMMEKWEEIYNNDRFYNINLSKKYDFMLDNKKGKNK